MERQILDILRKRKTVTESALMNRFNLSQLSVHMILRSLQRKGLVKRTKNRIAWKAVGND